MMFVIKCHDVEASVTAAAAAAAASLAATPVTVESKRALQSDGAGEDRKFGRLNCRGGEREGRHCASCMLGIIGVDFPMVDPTAADVVRVLEVCRVYK